MAMALDMSLDEMVYGQQNEKARVRIADNELLIFLIKLNFYPKIKNKPLKIYSQLLSFLDSTNKCNF